MSNVSIETKEWLDQRLKERRREETIWCPYCNLEFVDDDYNCVTVWGEPDTNTECHEITCYHCEKDFLVEEIVRRTYESRKIK